MTEHELSFVSKLWKYASAKSAWFFVTLPSETADQIRFFYPHRHGFGSVPVRVSIGESVWKTSVFPDKKTGSFILPIKSEIRKAERIREGDELSISLVVRP